MGKWIRQATKRHIHDNPGYVLGTLANRPTDGDQWECSCGEVFVVTHAFHDGIDWIITWEQEPK